MFYGQNRRPCSAFSARDRRQSIPAAEVASAGLYGGNAEKSAVLEEGGSGLVILLRRWCRKACGEGRNSAGSAPIFPLNQAEFSTDPK